MGENDAARKTRGGDGAAFAGLGRGEGIESCSLASLTCLLQNVAEQNTVAWVLGRKNWV